jgi:hypothetical protein
MSRLKTIKTIASTLTVALSIGFVAQYGETTPDMDGAEVRETYNKAPRSLMLSTNAEGQAVFGVPNIVTTPLDHTANAQRVVAVDSVYTEFDSPHFQSIMALPMSGCNTTFSARREPAALVTLSVSSPCLANESFVISHSGMRVSATTDRRGNAQIVVPALVPNAAFDVTFANILKASTEIFVPELRRYDRAVLQWSTTDNMRLHALENGAQIGEPGHVWSASFHTAEDTRAGKNGFVLFIGDAEAEIPYQAEVYTFPEGQMNRNSGVDLRVGVTVTAANCGREVDAGTIQTNSGQTLVVKEIALQMPACDQVGEVTLIRNKFTNLAVVSN